MYCHYFISVFCKIVLRSNWRLTLLVSCRRQSDQTSSSSIHWTLDRYSMTSLRLSINTIIVKKTDNSSNTHDIMSKRRNKTFNRIHTQNLADMNTNPYYYEHSDRERHGRPQSHWLRLSWMQFHWMQYYTISLKFSHITVIPKNQTDDWRSTATILDTWPRSRPQMIDTTQDRREKLKQRKKRTHDLSTKSRVIDPMLKNNLDNWKKDNGKFRNVFSIVW